jgi:hypothetical protein
VNWQAEIDTARRDVWAELDDTERAICADVPVVGVVGDGTFWGRYFPFDRRIEVASDAFDAMPDPENRERQLRDVIRHELHHALGEMHPQQGHSRISDQGWQWLTGHEITMTRGDLVVTLPDMIR